MKGLLVCWCALALVAAVACTAAPAPARHSPGWQVTVYYTAVESFHHGRPQQVTGCARLDCTHGHDNLGSYPADFVQAVHDEGTGQLTGGRYLNWSSDTGFWLDSAARDTHGRPLRPWVSAAADDLADGTPVRLANCGRQDDGTPVPGDVCGRLSAAHWQILDAFTPGLGGHHHIDLYLGPETAPNFTNQPLYTTLVNADLIIG